MEHARVDTTTVMIKVPPVASYLALLRTVVGGCAAREGLTLDQIDDVKMAVDEAASRLLERTTGPSLDLTARVDAEALEIRLQATTDGSEAAFDPTSFSWTILTALTDDLDLESGTDVTAVVLRKNRTPLDGAPGAGLDDAQGAR